MAWLIWHLGRVEDAQVASAAGLEQVWTSQGFVGRFDLPLQKRDTGYGHSSVQVDSVKAPPALLLEYYDAVHRQTWASCRPSATRIWTASSTPAGTRPSPSACGWSAPLPTASSTWGRPRTPRA